MRGASYRKRLATDLPRWSQQGWVTPDGAAAILASFEDGRPALGLSAVVGTLGAVLLGLGVLAFIGANWEYMPRPVRFCLLVGSIGVIYAIAAALSRRSLPALADAAVLLAGLVFAASIALVGQTYHLSGEFADAVLLWLVGCFGAALLTGSVGATVLTLAGAAYWTWLCTLEAGLVPHWGGLAAILSAGALAAFLESRLARLFAVLAVIFWTATTIGATADRLNWTAAGTLALSAQIALLLWAAGSALAARADRRRLAGLGYDALLPALVILLGVLAVLQATPSFNEAPSQGVWVALSLAALVVAVGFAALARYWKGLGSTDVVALGLIGAAALAFAASPMKDGFLSRLLGGCLVLTAIMWAIMLGQIGRHRVGKTLGLIAFGLEAFYLYVVTLGTVLDTAFAFLLGGLLFIGLSYLLVRIDRQLSARRKAGQ